MGFTWYNDSMNRSDFIRSIGANFRSHPIVGLLGPRQCGKTTLAKMYAQTIESQPFHHFDLEDPTHLALLEHPKLTLEPLEGLIIIDEVQLRPDLFPVLRVLADNYKAKQQYLILGSTSRQLLQQSSESLAGRIAYIELTPFNYSESHDMQRLWLRGGYPLAYLAETESDSRNWRKNYLRTFFEVDVPALGIEMTPANLQRCWMMLAHYHGNIANSAELGRSLNLSDTTIRRYLDILNGTFMIRSLQPWYENLGKRQVKRPKIYFRDSGLFHQILGITKSAELIMHPKVGASWEGFALEEIIRHHKAMPEECFFWATHNQAELDLLLTLNGKRLGFEFKYTDAPRMTRSMHIAMEDLALDSLTVIYPGEYKIPLSNTVHAIGLAGYLEGSNH